MPDTDSDCTILGFLLIDGFALMSYASVIEPFRAANILSGRQLYAWRHYSVTGAPARASNGVDMMVDGVLDFTAVPDMLFVCAGGTPSAFRHGATLARLRGVARRGTVMVGVSGGPFVLARAGLLEGYRCTIHWEHEAAFAEAFPTLTVEPSLYVLDRARLTCAGGTAGLDLAIEIIAGAHGTALARRVGEWFIRTQPREGDGAQRQSIASHGLTHPGMVAALEAMQAELAEPLDRGALAARAGVSLRQLERLFAGHLGTTIGRHHLGLRLDAGRRLLRETPLSRGEVAVACGFADVGHFSRSFRARFGTSPSAMRRGLER